MESVFSSNLSAFGGTKQESGRAGFHASYSLGEKIGRGNFAQVRAATRTTDGFECAVKIIDLGEFGHLSAKNKKAKIQAVTDEAAVLRHLLPHENVIQLHEAYVNKNYLYIVMEKAEQPLSDLLEDAPAVNESSLAKLFIQMAHGLKHVHENGVVHRDVKPDNFVCGGPDGQTLKLCDFGLSAIMPACGYIDNDRVIGTAPYIAPEVLRNRCYTEAVDMWSLGVVVYVLLYGIFPYMPSQTSSEAMKKAIRDGIQSPRYEPVCGFTRRSEEAVAFCKGLLERDPESRLSAEKALETRYMFQAQTDSPEMSPISPCSGSSIESTLPSLRPMFFSAKKYGAFEVHKRLLDDVIDYELNQQQMKCHGEPLPADDDRQKRRRTRAKSKRHTSRADIPSPSGESNGTNGSTSWTAWTGSTSATTSNLEMTIARSLDMTPLGTARMGTRNSEDGSVSTTDGLAPSATPELGTEESLVAMRYFKHATDGIPWPEDRDAWRPAPKLAQSLPRFVEL